MKIALVIGTVHAVLNHFDEIIAMDVSRTNLLQMLFTYFVPYTVATHGSAMQARHRELEMMVAENGQGFLTTKGPLTVPSSTAETIRLNLDLLWKYALDPVCMKRAMKVAFVVGSVIGIINHFDEIIEGTLTTTNYLQIGITYSIPYFVSTYGSARQATHMKLQECLE